MRIALFGGSFDPPHRGHIAIARAAADAFALDRVFFTPAGRQPLKTHPHSASFADRLAMTALACAEDPRFEPSDFDAPRPDGLPNYTVETLESLCNSYPEAEIFNLAGADSFATLARWQAPQELLALAQWIVVSRPGHLLADPEGLTLSPAQRTRIHLLDSVHEDVAATNLRERLAHGDPCTDLLPEAVAAFIQQHHLYLEGTGASVPDPCL
jgi:nicotinate-nucleotide adenylyltransferase